MRMIYCVRTAMVTSSAANITTAVIKKPHLEENTLPESNWADLNGSVNEARRAPEVIDDDPNVGSETLPSPTVEAWKATFKDHKAIYKNRLINI